MTSYVLVDLLNQQAVGPFPSEDEAWTFAFTAPTEDHLGLAWGDPTRPHADPFNAEFKKNALVLPLLMKVDADALWHLRREAGQDGGEATR